MEKFNISDDDGGVMNCLKTKQLPSKIKDLL